jgi:hypothetical protein
MRLHWKIASFASFSTQSYGTSARPSGGVVVAYKNSSKIAGTPRHVAPWLESTEQRLAAFTPSLSERSAARGLSATKLILRMTGLEIASYLGMNKQRVSRFFRTSKGHASSA